MCNRERCWTVGPAWQSLWTPWCVIRRIPSFGEVVEDLVKMWEGERDVARTDIVDGWSLELSSGCKKNVRDDGRGGVHDMLYMDR